jgi:MoxR-like ATPase
VASVDPQSTARTKQRLEQALFEIRRVIAGQDQMLERVIVCLLTGGHLLIEGVPGLAKTLTVKTTANVLGGTFNRIQFTPDLVPGPCSATSCSPTRSTARRRRCSRRCSR